MKINHTKQLAWDNTKYYIHHVAKTEQDVMKAIAAMCRVLHAKEKK